MKNLKLKPKKRLFCYTVVHEFTGEFEPEMEKGFLDDIKSFGATAEAIRDLRYIKTATWSETDETGTSTHAVEVIER